LCPTFMYSISDSAMRVTARWFRHTPCKDFDRKSGSLSPLKRINFSNKLVIYRAVRAASQWNIICGPRPALLFVRARYYSCMQPRSALADRPRLGDEKEAQQCPMTILPVTLKHGVGSSTTYSQTSRFCLQQ